MEWEDYLEDNLELARAEARLEQIAAFVREGVISEDVAFNACDDPEALRKLLSETV